MEHNIFCQNMTVYLFYFCMNMKYDNYDSYNNYNKLLLWLTITLNMEPSILTFNENMIW